MTSAQLVSFMPTINIKELSVEKFIEHLNDVSVTHNARLKNQIQQAKLLSHLNIENLSGYDAPLADVWSGIIENLFLNIKSMMKLIKQIPGIGFINKNDLEIMISRHLFDYSLASVFTVYRGKSHFVI